MSTLLLAGYVFIAALSLVMTQRERHSHQDQPYYFAIFGIVACLLWPISLAVALVMQFQQDNEADTQA